VRFDPRFLRFVATHWESRPSRPRVQGIETTNPQQQEPTMFDRIFSAALTFCVLAGATLAIGSAILEKPQAVAKAMQVVQLPCVTITGKRSALDATLAQASSAQPTGRQVQ
jgi:hypothetical protein